MTSQGKSKGRGAGFNTPNRFQQLQFEPLNLEPEDDGEPHFVPTQYYKDTSRTILAKNDSPDVPYTYSLNPYRGCEHGCIYCYARTSHEYLGFSAGLDFETKIMVKHDAPELLEAEFQKKTWKPSVVALSGITDPYQPIERKLEITRRLLGVFLKYRNPVGIITKNFLISRDLDVLKPLAELNLVSVCVSFTSLDADLANRMEPRTAAPHKRLELLNLLSANGIHAGVLTAPIIPGLNDEEIPSLLREAAANGAKFAGWTMLRLTGSVEPLFLEWVRREYPDRASKIINRIKEVHGGKMTDSRFGVRMRGEGQIAEAIRKLHRLNSAKYGLNGREYKLSVEHFRRITKDDKQMEMF